jgi:hypothetical protein
MSKKKYRRSKFIYKTEKDALANIKSTSGKKLKTRHSNTEWIFIRE